MIDEQVFRDSWTLLCERFNREPSRALAIAYYRDLSPRLTTERFKEAFNRIFRDNEFFPKPGDFLARTDEDRTADALTAWETTERLMRGFARIEDLDPEARRVVRLLGGETKLRNTDINAVQYVRRDFMELYGDAVTVAEREAGRRIEATPEGKQITDSIMRGEGLRLVSGEDAA